MARVCDSCDKKFDHTQATEVRGEIPRFGISGAGFKTVFEITFYDPDDNEEPDVCPACIIRSIKDSIEKWPSR